MNNFFDNKFFRQLQFLKYRIPEIYMIDNNRHFHGSHLASYELHGLK